MDKNANENPGSYGRWLIATCVEGGLVGWIVQGMLQGYLFWSLPLFCLVAFGFTLNGDNIIESLVVLLILGVVALMLWKNQVVVQKVGPGTMWGIYVSLCISKLGFALGKAGAVGNNQFS